MVTLSDLVVVFHLAYASFVTVGFILIIVGGILRWRWVRNPVFRWIHLACIAIVALEALVGLICPLTVLENYLLISSGQTGYERTFIGQLVYDLLYYDLPTWVFTTTYVSLAALTALALVLLPPVRHLGHRQT